MSEVEEVGEPAAWWEELAWRAQTRADAAGCSSRPVVLIDGRAGAGKTTLARWMGQALGCPVVSLDDVYPGWTGLAAATEAVPGILAGEGYCRWDWEQGRPGGHCSVSGAGGLVVEGCGCLSAAARRVAPHAVTVWVDGPRGWRRARALARDPYFAPWWELWARQEEDHMARLVAETTGVADGVLPRGDDSSLGGGMSGEFAGITLWGGADQTPR